MTTSQTGFLSHILEDGPIPLGKLAYFRQRFRHRLYGAVIEEFLKRQTEGLTLADVAKRINVEPEQVRNWLGTPGDWTLETVSDLFLAIAKSEPKITAESLFRYMEKSYYEAGLTNEAEVGDKLNTQTQFDRSVNRSQNSDPTSTQAGLLTPITTTQNSYTSETQVSPINGQIDVNGWSRHERQQITSLDSRAKSYGIYGPKHNRLDDSTIPLGDAA